MCRVPKVAFSLALLLSVLLPVASEPEYRAAIVPKPVGIAYYGAVKRGAEEDAQELPATEAIRSGPARDAIDPGLHYGTGKDEASVAPSIRTIERADI